MIRDASTSRTLNFCIVLDHDLGRFMALKYEPQGLYCHGAYEMNKSLPESCLHLSIYSCGFK
jgi:hypothetical protein